MQAPYKLGDPCKEPLSLSQTEFVFLIYLLKYDTETDCLLKMKVFILKVPKTSYKYNRTKTET